MGIAPPTSLDRGGPAASARIPCPPETQLGASDAVATLGYLFLGHRGPTCLDAADADDSGAVELTDPIFLLGVLFLGQNAFPAPHPDCGTDPTADRLDCRRGCGQAAR